ncbi:MAG: hypothetical protein KGL39_08090 [Patescibacteria group bacterium]|nr:hypothetical protein [Patescibacteria group bacterium]
MKKPEWMTSVAAALPGSGYTDDESEFIGAISRWQDRHPGKRPDCCDVLEIAKSLGYRRESNASV